MKHLEIKKTSNISIKKAEGWGVNKILDYLSSLDDEHVFIIGICSNIF